MNKKIAEKLKAVKKVVKKVSSPILAGSYDASLEPKKAATVVKPPMAGYGPETLPPVLPVAPPQPSAEANRITVTFRLVLDDMETLEQFESAPMKHDVPAASFANGPQIPKPKKKKRFVMKNYIRNAYFNVR